MTSTANRPTAVVGRHQAAGHGPDTPSRGWRDERFSGKIWDMRKLAILFLALLLTGCTPDHFARYEVKSDSMAPTIKADTTVTARSVEPGSYKGQHGDIVVFSKPDSWPGDASLQVKRVIAIGGETVSCCNAAGQVTVNDRPLDEPYIGENSRLDGPADGCRGRRFDPVAVPTGQLFVLGDNRFASVDSACHGPIPSDSVIGIV